MDVTHITFYLQQPYLHVVIVNSFGLFINVMKMFMPSLPLFNNVLQLWECLLNLKQTMDLLIQVIDLNSFVKNGTFFVSLISLIIHKDKLLLKGHIEL
jgi:hypothetical protein